MRNDVEYGSSLIVSFLRPNEDGSVSADPQLQHHLVAGAEHGEHAALNILMTLHLYQQTEFFCKTEHKTHQWDISSTSSTGSCCSSWGRYLKKNKKRNVGNQNNTPYPSVKSRVSGRAKVAYCPTWRTGHPLPCAAREVFSTVWTESSCRMFTSSVDKQFREKHIGSHRCWSFSLFKNIKSSCATSF